MSSNVVILQVRYIRSVLKRERMPMIFVDTIRNAQGQNIIVATYTFPIACQELLICSCVCNSNNWNVVLCLLHLLTSKPLVYFGFSIIIDLETNKWPHELNRRCFESAAAASTSATAACCCFFKLPSIDHVHAWRCFSKLLTFNYNYTLHTT